MPKNRRTAIVVWIVIAIFVGYCVWFLLFHSLFDWHSLTRKN